MPSSQSTTIRHASALTSKPPLRSSANNCCTSNVNPPASLRWHDGNNRLDRSLFALHRQSSCEVQRYRRVTRQRHSCRALHLRPLRSSRTLREGTRDPAISSRCFAVSPSFVRSVSWSVIYFPIWAQICSLNVLLRIFRLVAELAGLRYDGAMFAMRHIIEFRSGFAGSALLGLLLSCP